MRGPVSNLEAAAGGKGGALIGNGDDEGLGDRVRPERSGRRFSAFRLEDVAAI